MKILIVFFSYFGICSYQRLCEKTERAEFTKTLIQNHIIQRASNGQAVIVVDLDYSSDSN